MVQDQADLSLVLKGTIAQQERLQALLQSTKLLQEAILTTLELQASTTTSHVDTAITALQALPPPLSVQTERIPTFSELQFAQPAQPATSARMSK